MGGQEFYVDNVCVFEEGDADIPTLAELQQLDASVIASMLDFSSYLDTNNCQVAAALNLPEDFPVLTGASVNLVGAVTGEVYASSDVLSGAGIVSIPDPANGEALLISITLGVQHRSASRTAWQVNSGGILGRPNFGAKMGKAK